MSSTPIRILIADGHPIVLEGLRTVLARQTEIELVGEASDGVEAIEKTVSLDPDVVLMELKLPRVDGLTVLRSIQARASRSKVILFSSSENKEEFVEAMKIGCRGIISKSASISLIEKSIQKVHAGEIWLDSHTTAAVIRQFSSPSDFPAIHGGNGKSSRDRPRSTKPERKTI